MTNSKRLCIAGRFAVLQAMAIFCREVYISAFGPVKGEELYRNLTIAGAVDLYLSACKDGTAELPV